MFVPQRIVLLTAMLALVSTPALRGQETATGAEALVDPVGTFRFTSRTFSDDRPFNGVLTVAGSDAGWAGRLETGVMPAVDLETVTVGRRSLTATARLRDALLVVRFRFEDESDSFIGDWWFGPQSRPLEGARETL